MNGRQHTSPAALGIRVAGIACLALAWFVGRHLYHQVHAHALRPASLKELATCAVLLISALIGNALLLVGPALWREVDIPGRQPYGALEAQQLERLMDAKR